MKVKREPPKRQIESTPPLALLIDSCINCPLDELAGILESHSSWYYPKHDLYFWADLLDRFDEVLSQITNPENENPGNLSKFEVLLSKNNPARRRLLCSILNFTILLLRNCAGKH
eukprot:Sdes_comp16455_c0_seq1m5787